jgi:hypothetical protein
MCCERQRVKGTDLFCGALLQRIIGIYIFKEKYDLCFAVLDEAAAKKSFLNALNAKSE